MCFVVPCFENFIYPAIACEYSLRQSTSVTNVPGHRPTGIFQPGGAVTFLPEKKYVVPECQKKKKKKKKKGKEKKRKKNPGIYDPRI